MLEAFLRVVSTCLVFTLVTNSPRAQVNERANVVLRASWDSRSERFECTIENRSDRTVIFSPKAPFLVVYALDGGKRLPVTQDGSNQELGAIDYASSVSLPPRSSLTRSLQPDPRFRGRINPGTQMLAVLRPALVHHFRHDHQRVVAGYKDSLLKRDVTSPTFLITN